MRYETYSVEFTFRDLGFLVIGILDPIGVRDEEINGEPVAVLQFWPRATRMIVWPPEGGRFRRRGNAIPPGVHASQAPCRSRTRSACASFR